MSPLDELRRHLFSLKKPFILGHSRADPDAVASSYALSKILNAPFGFPDEPSYEGKALLKFLNAPYELCPSLKGKDVIIVDTSERSMLPCIDLELASSVTVIDHHASSPTINGKLFIFRTTSTSEIIYRAFKELLDDKAKKALALGIFYDTKGFKIANGILLSLVGEMLGETPISHVLSLINLEENISEKIARFKALRRSEVYRWKDYLIVVAEARSFEGSVASAILSLGADAAIAWTQEKERGFFSFRIRERILNKGVNVYFLDSLLKKVGGSCGGHEAAGVCTAQRIDIIVKEIAEEILKQLGAQEVRVY